MEATKIQELKVIESYAFEVMHFNYDRDHLL